MKKIFTVIALLVALIGASFSSSAQFRYGPMVGLDITTLKFKQKLVTVDQSVGYNAGVQCELMFPGIGLGLNFGLQYQQRGATIHFGEKEIWASQGVGTMRSYLHYAAIPFNLRFKWTRMHGLEDYIAPYVFGGPVFEFLLAHNKVSPFKYTGAEIGLQCGLGFELYKKWQVEAGYIWGMSRACETKLLEDLTVANRGWSVRVAYLF